MSSLSRELVFLILQFLDEEKFRETVHKYAPLIPSRSPSLLSFCVFFFLVRRVLPCRSSLEFCSPGEDMSLELMLVFSPRAAVEGWSRSRGSSST